ncbi:polyketide synthase dehydratase domain-containing protein [Nocardia cyriacigeorgica]|uniref:polyketide synthase dehydratase domain-containing protein n=1 Tax=Nocardia cyriacigeorgica TaxID=135487 RepID=UPI0024574C33|nr:polyketide synthase dehydratase domain-containing protein [Nocardia cyriacigeorgica]
MPPGVEPAGVAAPAARRDTDETVQFTAFLATAERAGLEVDWLPMYAGREVRRVPLPTYAFDRQRYWLAPTDGLGDLTRAGLMAIDHPMLAAAVAMAGTGEWLFTGRLSTSTQTWIADHTVFGAVLLPGTAFVELALAAGARLGAELVDELVLEAPLRIEDEARDRYPDQRRSSRCRGAPAFRHRVPARRRSRRGRDHPRPWGARGRAHRRG